MVGDIICADHGCVAFGVKKRKGMSDRSALGLLNDPFTSSPFLTSRQTASMPGDAHVEPELDGFASMVGSGAGVPNNLGWGMHVWPPCE